VQRRARSRRISRIDGHDDAARIANESPYGLSGTVFSADREWVAAVAARRRVGTVNVNRGVWYCADARFGGYRQSGIKRAEDRRSPQQVMARCTKGVGGKKVSWKRRTMPDLPAGASEGRGHAARASAVLLISFDDTRSSHR
jgi:hypothetical protein